MSTITAKDLTKEVPRSPLEELDGVPWLPRLIDKVRALKAGTLGDYTPYPCGGDRSFLTIIGVDAEQLKVQIDSGASDSEIALWVKAHAAPGLDGTLAAYRERALAPVSDGLREHLDVAIGELKTSRPDLDTTSVDNFTRLLCLDEGHPCPGL